MTTTNRSIGPGGPHRAGRALLAVVAAAMLVAGACSGGADDPSSAAEPGTNQPGQLAFDGSTVVEFTVQTGVPSTSIYHELMIRWGDRLTEMSGGRLRPTVVAAGEVVGALDILDAVHSGVVPVGMAWSNYWTSKSDSAALFSNPPVGSTGMDQATSLAWMYDGGGLELYERLYTEDIGMNVKPLPIMPMGPDPFGWFSEPIASVDDVEGLSFRSPPGLPGLTFDQLGMEAIAMSGADIVPAAERGIIDGAEWISPADDRALGLAEVWGHYYLQGLHQSTDIGELLINRDWWDALPTDLKAIVRVATQASIVDSQNASITANAAAVAQYQADGIQLWNTPPDISAAFIDAWNEVAAELEAEDPFFAEVRASQQAYAASVMPYRLTVTELWQTIGEHYYPTSIASDP